MVSISKQSIKSKDFIWQTIWCEYLSSKGNFQDLSSVEELVMVGYPIVLSDTRNNYPIF